MITDHTEESYQVAEVEKKVQIFFLLPDKKTEDLLPENFHARLSIWIVSRFEPQIGHT